MSRFLSSFAFLVALTIVPLAFADTPSQSPSLYFVDMQRAIDQSIIGKGAKATMENDIKKRQEGLSVLKNEVEKMKADLDKQASLLAPDALERQIHDQREELAKKNSESIAKIVKEIDLIIKDLAKQENYGFILEKDPAYVLYLSDKYDVTDEVIKLLDKKKTEL
jgi:outer membrane protein